MKKSIKGILIVLGLVLVLTTTFMPALAADAQVSDKVISSKAISAALVVGLTATAGAIGMAWAIVKSVDGIARQPEAEGKIRTAMMLGLVFVETAIIYALVVGILIIFVL